MPPAAFFGSVLKRTFGLNLPWLYTHIPCNSSYREDEEYTVAALAGHARSTGGDAVMEALRAAFRQGHKQGLLRMIVGGFGKLVGPRGEVTFDLYSERVRRIAWKLARGLYYRELGIVLPESRPGHVYIINPLEAAEQTAQIPWYENLLAAAPMGDKTYAAIFDYKWISQKDGELRGHAIGVWPPDDTNLHRPYELAEGDRLTVGPYTANFQEGSDLFKMLWRIVEGIADSILEKREHRLRSSPSH